MARRRRTVDEIVHEVQRSAREQVIARAARGDVEIAEAWAPTLERLRDRLMRARPDEVQGIVYDAQREMARAAIRPTQRSIRAGSRVGLFANQRQHAELTAEDGPVRATARQREVSAPTLTAERARDIANARIRGETAPGGLRLSSRIHRRTREAAEHATQVVRSSIEARQSIFEASEAFLERAGAQMVVARPRYIDEIATAARVARDTGDRTHLLDAVERHARQMNALGEGNGRDGMYSLRSSVRQFTQDVQLRPQDVDRLLEQHMRDRAQYQARRIVRHDTAEAMRASYLESVRGQPYTQGLRWVLSPAHPRPDVCDLYAMQALHGLGPGGYPLDAVPETPHPLCLCQHEAIIDRFHFRRQLAEARGEEPPPREWENPNTQTAHEWLAEQPDDFRRELLGPTRQTIFDRSVADRNRVIDGRGRPIPVADVLSNLSRPAPTYTATRAPARLDPLQGLTGRYVGAAPLEGRGRDVVLALGDTTAGWEGRAREEMRAAIADTFPGIRIREPRIDRRSSIVVENVLDQGRSGDHDFTTREVTLDTEIMRQARVGSRAVTAGRRMTERQGRGVLVALHEEMHVTSPMSPLAYSDEGRVIEEMTNEGLARTLAVRLGMFTEEQALRIGSYPSAMSETLAWMGEHVPGMADATSSERLARLAQAGHRIRRRAAVIRRGEYAEVFLDALDVPPEGRETAVDGLRAIERLLDAPTTLP